MAANNRPKLIFLVTTIVSGVAFWALTANTLEKVKVPNLDPQVARGKVVFEKNNCMGCHTILGEGGYYAPELTKVFDRRQEAYIHSILKNPQAIYPGHRQMQNYNFSEEDIQSLIAFLKWAGQLNLSGFPAPADLRTTVGEVPLVYNQSCRACHSLGGQGGTVGPALDGVGGRRDPEFIRTWIADPQAMRPDTQMPKMPLSEDQIEALTKFLSGLK